MYFTIALRCKLHSCCYGQVWSRSRRRRNVFSVRGHVEPNHWRLERRRPDLQQWERKPHLHKTRLAPLFPQAQTQASDSTSLHLCRTGKRIHRTWQTSHILDQSVRTAQYLEKRVRARQTLNCLWEALDWQKVFWLNKLQMQKAVEVPRASRLLGPIAGELRDLILWALDQVDILDIQACETMKMLYFHEDPIDRDHRASRYNPSPSPLYFKSYSNGSELTSVYWVINLGWSILHCRRHLLEDIKQFLQALMKLHEADCQTSEGWRKSCEPVRDAIKNVLKGEHQPCRGGLLTLVGKEWTMKSVKALNYPERSEQLYGLHRSPMRAELPQRQETKSKKTQRKTPRDKPPDNAECSKEASSASFQEGR